MARRTPERPAAGGGKGRPTPKRRDVERRRQGVVPAPENRKEAARRRREKLREARQAQRRALRHGDERNLPRWAAGPEKAAVRDAVDSRRSLGWLALPGGAVAVASLAVPDLRLRQFFATMSFFVFMVLLADMVSAGLRIRRVLRQRFPEGTKERRFTLVRYGVGRNTQFRRTRMPPPRVKPGENIDPG